jgi:hypothetical protein
MTKSLVTDELLEGLKNPAVEFDSFLNEMIHISLMIIRSEISSYRTLESNSYFWYLINDVANIDLRLVPILISKVIALKRKGKNKPIDFIRFNDHVPFNFRSITINFFNDAIKMIEQILQACKLLVLPDELSFDSKVVERCLSTIKSGKIVDLSKEVTMAHKELFIELGLRTMTYYPLWDARRLCFHSEFKFEDIFTTEVLIQLFELGLTAHQLTKEEVAAIQSCREAWMTVIDDTLDGYSDLAWLTVDYMLPTLI